MDIRLVVAGALGVPAVALVIGLCTLSSAAGWGSSPTAPLCVTAGAVAGLSNAAAGNARIVVAVAEQAGGDMAAMAAVAAGLAESGLRVLGNVDGQQGDIPVQGIGDDHDSLGIFQQRPSWGPVAQRLDPAASTRLFVTRLLADPGWQAKPPWVAAQDVQDSAYDGVPRPANHDSGVYGGNYRAMTPLAQRLVAAIDRDTRRQQCGVLNGGRPAGPVSRHGLPVDYAISPEATPAEAAVIAFAIAQLDKPYKFDAAGPDSYDCSGLTMAAWAQVGIALPHWTVTQAQSGTPVLSPAAMAPGDLVLVAGDDGTLAAPGHVGLYIGDGLVLNAADERDGIRVQTFADFVRVGHGLSAIRHIA